MTLLFLLLLVVVGLVLQRRSLKTCLNGLKYALSPERQAVEIGEAFALKTTVTNTSPLPVLFLRISENVPVSLSTCDMGGTVRRIEREIMGQSTQVLLEQTVYLMPRQSLQRSLSVSLPARGRYLFRGATLTAGDLLGLEERSGYFSCLKEVVVLPAKAAAPEIDKAMGGFLGELSVRRFVLSDPILTLGFREYTGREPQRDISWQRTLREGKLMVKQYDYTAEPCAAVLLNICGGTPEETEQCFRLARGLCEKLEDKRIRYAFLTNATTAGAAGIWSFQAEGLGSSHLAAILEGMGRATYDAAFSFGRLMDMAGKHTEKNRGYFLVTPSLGEKEAALLKSFELRSNQRVFILTANAGNGEVRENAC